MTLQAPVSTSLTVSIYVRNPQSAAAVNLTVLGLLGPIVVVSQVYSVFTVVESEIVVRENISVRPPHASGPAVNSLACTSFPCRGSGGLRHSGAGFTLRTERCR